MPDLSIIRPEIHLNGDKTCNDLPPPQACQEAITLASLGSNHCPPSRQLAYSTVRNLLLFSAGARKKDTNQMKNCNCLIRNTGNLSVSPYPQDEYLLNTASRGENRQGLAHYVQIRFFIALSLDRDKRRDPHPAQPRLNFSGLRF